MSGNTLIYIFIYLTVAQVFHFADFCLKCRVDPYNCGSCTWLNHLSVNLTHCQKLTDNCQLYYCIILYYTIRRLSQESCVILGCQNTKKKKILCSFLIYFWEWSSSCNRSSCKTYLSKDCWLMDNIQREIHACSQSWCPKTRLDCLTPGCQVGLLLLSLDWETEWISLSCRRKKRRHQASERVVTFCPRTEAR